MEQRFVTRYLMLAMKLCNHGVLDNISVQDIPRNSGPILSQSEEISKRNVHGWCHNDALVGAQDKVSGLQHCDVCKPCNIMYLAKV